MRLVGCFGSMFSSAPNYVHRMHGCIDGSMYGGVHVAARVSYCYHILHDLKGQSVDEQECALIWQMMRAQPVAFFDIPAVVALPMRQFCVWQCLCVA